MKKEEEKEEEEEEEKNEEKEEEKENKKKKRRAEVFQADRWTDGQTDITNLSHFSILQTRLEAECINEV